MGACEYALKIDCARLGAGSIYAVLSQIFVIFVYLMNSSAVQFSQAGSELFKAYVQNNFSFQDRERQVFFQLVLDNSPSALCVWVAHMKKKQQSTIIRK